MLKSRMIAGVGLIVAGAGLSFGQPYPSRPIRIVTSEPGTSNDFSARIIAQELSAAVGHQVIVDNRAGRNVPATLVARSGPDGYNLVVSGSTLWLAPFLQATTPYDPVRDFVPITLVSESPNILVVHPSVPVASVKELIALAKAKPGTLNCAVSVAGGSVHLAAELFASLTATNIVRVPFKGAGAALTALIGGEIQLMFPVAPSVAPHLKTGRLRALAVTTARPSALAPGLVTVAASVPGFEAGNTIAIFAPAKTPPAIVSRLNQEIVRVLNNSEVKERFFKAGSEARGTSPDEFAAMMKSDMLRMGKLIKDAGIRAD